MSLFKTIKQEFSELDWKNNKWALIFGFFAISPTIGPLPPMTPLYYACLLVTLLIYAKYINGYSSIVKPCVLFLIASVCSLIANDTPVFFHAPIRLSLFTIVFCVVSPLLQNNPLRKFRKNALGVILKLCVVIAVVSFVFYFLNINYMTYMGDASYLNSAGRFGGLTTQSMLLAPISAFASMYCLYKSLYYKNVWYFLLIIPCVGCVLFAASRSSFLSLLIGSVLMFYVFSKNKKQFVKIVFLFSIIGAFTFPLWQGALEGLQEKQERNLEMGSTTISRNEKWRNRIEEFKGNPVFGIGFCTCDPKYREDYSLVGGVESGSSWLSVLSTTGLVGFFSFCWIILNSVIVLFKNKSKETALIIGILAFVCCHMFVEGYISYAGSTLCIIAWLVIGCSYDVKYNITEK